MLIWTLEDVGGTIVYVVIPRGNEKTEGWSEDTPSESSSAQCTTCVDCGGKCEPTSYWTYAKKNLFRVVVGNKHVQEVLRLKIW